MCTGPFMQWRCAYVTLSYNRLHGHYLLYKSVIIIESFDVIQNYLIILCETLQVQKYEWCQNVQDKRDVYRVSVLKLFGWFRCKIMFV